MIFLIPLVLQVYAQVDLESTTEITISPYGKVEAQISSKPSSGYLWYMLPDESGKIEIPSCKGNYKAGKQVFTIACNEFCEPGDHLTLKMFYRRIWEPQPTKILYIHLKVISD